MNGNSRTSNTLRNVGISFVFYFFTYIAVFISRTYFVKLLGNEYLSLNGLFTNLITIVSFSELGLGSASIYCFYKPISDKDYGKISSYLRYFHKLYKVVIAVSIIISISLIPALPYIVDIESLTIPFGQIVLFYCLFAANTVSTYFFVESKLFLIADQKNYVANIIQQTIHISQLVLQVIYLLWKKDFVGFLVIQIFSSLVTNIAIHLYVKSKYQYVFQTQTTILEKREKKQVTSNIGSIFFYKVGAVILNGTDNIIISTFVKTLLVGICSNYLLIINAVNSLLMQCFNGIGASIGNHIVTANKKEQENVFRQLNILCVMAFSFSSICIYAIINPLINLWLGAEYILDDKTVVALIMVFFVTGVNQIPSLYRTAMGLFKKARFYPIMAAMANIILSIVLAKCLGLWGVFLATVFVRIVFFTCVDSILVYRDGFGKHPFNYFIRYLRDVLCVSIGCISARYLCGFIEEKSIMSLIQMFMVCTAVCILCIMIFYAPTKEFSKLARRIKRVVCEKN